MSVFKVGQVWANAGGFQVKIQKRWDNRECFEGSNGFVYSADNSLNGRYFLFGPGEPDMEDLVELLEEV